MAKNILSLSSQDAMEFAELIKGRIVNFTGRLFSTEHNQVCNG